MSSTRWKTSCIASKMLSTTQANYCNIERETPALMFGVTRFHTYLFGSGFHIHRDHKSLQMICNKSLMSAPPLLQRLLIKIQGHSFSFKYKPGPSSHSPTYCSGCLTQVSEMTYTSTFRVTLLLRMAQIPRT